MLVTRDQAIKFSDKYGEKGRGMWNIDWLRVADEYDGIVIMPNVFPKDIHWSSYDGGEDGVDDDFKLSWTTVIDVETLIVWNKSVIKKYKTLLNTKKYIHYTKDISKDEFGRCVNKLVTDIESNVIV